MFSVDISADNEKVYHIYGHNTGISEGLSNFVYNYEIHDLITASCIINGEVLHNRKKSITYLIGLIIDRVMKDNIYDKISLKNKNKINMEVKINGCSIIFLNFNHMGNYFTYSFNDISKKICKFDVIYYKVEECSDVLNRIKLILDIIKQ